MLGQQKFIVEQTQPFHREIKGWYVSNEELVIHAYNFLEDKWAGAEVKLRAKSLIQQIATAIHGTATMKYGLSLRLTYNDILDIVGNEFVKIVVAKKNEA